jgi:putative membrane protein
MPVTADHSITMKTNKSFHTHAACAAFALMSFGLVGPVLAQTPEESPTPYQGRANAPQSNASTGAPEGSEAKVGHSDKRFLIKAAKLGAEEVGISRVAEQNANNPKIRDFAKHMAAAHEETNSELAQLAASKGVTLPAAETDYSSWSTKSPKDFDEDYINKMIDAHEDAIDLFSKGAKSEDPDVAAFARKYLSVLKEHYAMAKELKKTTTD